MELADHLAPELHRPPVVDPQLLDPSADTVARLEHGHIGAARDEIARSRQAGQARPEHEDIGQPSSQLAVRGAEQQLARAVAVEQTEVEHRVDAVGGRREPRAGGRRIHRGRDAAVRLALLEQVAPRGRATSRYQRSTSGRSSSSKRRLDHTSFQSARCSQNGGVGLDADEQRALEPLGADLSPAISSSSSCSSGSRRTRTRCAGAPAASRSSSGREPSRHPPPRRRSPSAARGRPPGRRRGRQPRGSRRRGRSEAVGEWRLTVRILTYSRAARRYPD